MSKISTAYTQEEFNKLGEDAVTTSAIGSFSGCFCNYREGGIK